MAVWGSNYFRFFQLALAICGLIFSLSSRFMYWVLVLIFVVAAMYMIMIVICIFANRSTINRTAQAIVEVLIGLWMVFYVIFVVASEGEKDAFLIMSIVIGFILPALLFITAYDKT